MSNEIILASNTGNEQSEKTIIECAKRSDRGVIKDFKNAAYYTCNTSTELANKCDELNATGGNPRTIFTPQIWEVKKYAKN